MLKTISMRLVQRLSLASVAAIVASCSSPRRGAEVHDPLVARFFVESRASEYGRPVVLPQSGVFISIDPKPVIMEFDITDAEVAEVALGKCLLVRLTTAAARDLYRLTGSAQGRRLVLSLNDQVVGARKIDRPLDDGTILLFVERPDNELPGMVTRLKETSGEIRRKLAR
ncbi:MAG: hypothetical protein KAX37_01600 [Opitutaceae bacterium]|nr:hypothetical protein [Opitutaceae bacterium]